MIRPDLSPLALALLDTALEARTWPPGPMRDVLLEEEAAARVVLGREATDAREPITIPLLGGVSIVVRPEVRT